MEFTIEKDILKYELNLASGVLERKSTIPILANVLLRTIDGGSVELTVSDLDITFRAIVKAEVKKGGSVCIEARKLSDITNRAVGNEIRIKEDKDFWAKVESGASKYRIAGENPENFPSFDLEEIVFNQVNPFVLADAFDAVDYAVTNETSRFTMSGIKFALSDGKLLAVATNGHCLAIATKPHEFTVNSEIDCLIPKKACAEFQKQLLGVSEGETVEIGAESNHIVLRSEFRTVIARKLVGDFPKYEMMLPKGNDRSFTLNATDFADAIKRVAIVSNDRTQSVWLNISDGTLELSAKSAEEGEASEKMKIEFTGEAVKLGFRYSYLTDALAYLGESDCVFTFKDAVQQIEMQRAGSDDFQYVVSLLRF